MRPEAIRQFDYFYLGSIAAALVNAALSTWVTGATIGAGDLMGASPMMQYGAVGAVAAIAFLFAAVVPLTLWYLASRRAKAFARWIIIGLGALGFLRLAGILLLLGYLVVSRRPIEDAMWLTMILSLVTELLHMGAIGCLFMRDARRWFATGGVLFEADEVFS